MIDSDRNDSTDDLEIDIGSIETQRDEVDQQEESEEVESQTDEATNDESVEVEQVKTKKSGYIPIDDPAIKARVDELTRKMHAERKEKEAAYRELQKYQKEPEPPKEVPPPSADPVTDPEVYRQQWAAREQFIRDQVKYESEAEQRKQQSAATEQAKQEKLLATYNKNIERLKINQNELQAAANTVTQYGISKDLTEFLLEDDDGPAIVKFLHHNVDVLADVVNMSPAKAVSYIERAIRAKVNVKPISKAPPPPTRVNGSRLSSASVEVDGTTYE